MTRTLAILLLVTLAGVADASKPHLRELLSLATTHRQLETTCTVEPGTDYPGNDIKNVGNLPASACCEECRRTTGCGAWSWSNWNGGTCWLKTKKGTPATNPAVQSAVLKESPATCPITQNVDFVNYDIANVRASPAGACCGICKYWSGCKAFSWTNHNGGTCWLKSQKGTTRADSNVQSGEVNGPEICGLEHGVDYYDNDIGSVSGYPSAEGCCGVCQNWSGCRAFSWTALNGGTCWLKSRKGAVRNDPNVISSSVLPNLPSSCTLVEADKDYTNYDIANVKNGDANNCCDICKNWGGGGVCKAFSWSNYNGGTCWLKSQKGTPTNKAGVISGTV